MAQTSSPGTPPGQSQATSPPSGIAIHALATLRKDHPRLLVSDEDLERLRATIHDIPQARRIYVELSKEADRLQPLPPLEYRAMGTRLLTTTRHITDRIYTLALMYRLDRKRAHLDRAAKELRAIAAYHDWNPTRFLDTAELTHAMAIGYDWLYGALSPDDRQLVRDAIVQKGLDPAIPIFERQLNWTTSHFYWNPVCNGGLTLGALAVADAGGEEICRSAKRSCASQWIACRGHFPRSARTADGRRVRPTGTMRPSIRADAGLDGISTGYGFRTGGK